MIHCPDGRRTMSMPFVHGLSTSEFGRPLGFEGAASQVRATSPSMSKAPTFTGPWNATPAFSLSRIAPVRSIVSPVRSLLIRLTILPSSAHGEPVGGSTVKQTSETLTAAPSSAQGSSDQASVTLATFMIRSIARRLVRPRIELVATNPPALSEPFSSRSAHL
jgi:hypothetical protein